MGLIAFLIGNRFLGKRKQSMVPPGLRPGPSDEELERRFFIRQLAIGGILTLFMAVFLPAYFLREPVRIHERLVEFSKESVLRGADEYAPTGDPNNLRAVGCATCHGLKGEGGVRQFQGHTYAEPPLQYIVARYLAAGRNEEEIKVLIRDAIERGRPGTPMPTWGLQFGGPLNAEQIDDLLAFIYSIQKVPAQSTSKNGKAIFQENCAICHGTDASGGIGPNLTVEFQRLTEDQVRQTIMEGRLNINRPSMPSWAFLGHDAVEALVNFLKSIQRVPVK